MAIKINGKDLQKRIINGIEVEKVMCNGVQIRPESTHTDECIIFYYLANEAGSGQSTNLRIKSGISWDWDVYVDGVKMPHGSTVLRPGSDGQEHLVEIYPVNETYGWAKAFKGCGRMTRLIYDGTYKSFADSATSTGDDYRAEVYSSELLLHEIPESEEAIPDTVLYIGNNFRYDEFFRTGAITPRKETFPRNAVSIGNSFREGQYGRSLLQLTTLEEKISDSVLTIGNNFRRLQFYEGNVTNVIESMSENLTSAGDGFRSGQFYFAGISGNVTLIQNNNVSLTNKRNAQFDFYSGNTRNIVFNIVGNALEQLPSASGTYRGPMGLITNWVQSINVNNDLISSYQTTAPWDSLASKFI